jgi:hypothetical protein
MRQRPSSTRNPLNAIRRSATVLVVCGIFSLVLWLPLDRATLVAGLVGSVVAGVGPAWKIRSGQDTRPLRQRPASRRSWKGPGRADRTAPLD